MIRSERASAVSEAEGFMKGQGRAGWISMADQGRGEA